MKFTVGFVSASFGYALLVAPLCATAQTEALDTAASCTGLCLQQTTCPGVGTTSVSGIVYAPNGTDPIYNAMVYVPNGAAGAPTYGVTAFTSGVHCGQCGSEVSGSPLVSTLSAADGTFTLKNMPVGTNIPLVIQIGRWRRQITIPTVASCVKTTLPPSLTRLPVNQSEGDIPLMAISTGSADALECVLRKIGIADSEFSNPNGTGRVQFYTGEGSPGARIGPTTPSATSLYGSQATINQYDMVFFACQGDTFSKTAAEQQHIITYVNDGGRVFATHESYVWLYNIAPFSGTAAWQVEQAEPPDQTGYVNTSFDRGQALAQWLVDVGASTTSGQIPLNALRQDFNGVVPPSLLWLSLGAPPTGAFTAPMQYTFDTPVGLPTSLQCGRVAFNDYHVEKVSGGGTDFPAECTGGAMTPQEKLLEFTIFDLGSCLDASAQITAISDAASGGHAILVGTGNPNYPALIQFSPDLASFSLLGTPTTDSSGNFSFDDASSATVSKRFYRTLRSTP